MGRTLHYDLLENPAVTVTDSDWDRINRITEHFITSYKWTCEQPGFSGMDYYPRWPEWFRDSRLPNLPGGNTFDNEKKFRDLIRREELSLEAQGLSRLQITRSLLEKRMVAIHGDDPNCINMQKSHGFTKVTGSEWNALLVTAWLTAVSTVLPQHEFTLSDEGDFLLRKRILLRNGRARTERGRVWKDVGTFCRPVNPEDFSGDRANNLGDYYQTTCCPLDVKQMIRNIVSKALNETKT
jgi:hypothetical protein